MYSTEFSFFLLEKIGGRVNKKGRELQLFSKENNEQLKTVCRKHPLSSVEIMEQVRLLYHHHHVNDIIDGWGLVKIIGHNGNLVSFNLIQEKDQPCVEIQIARSTIEPQLFWLFKYIGLKIIMEETFICNNWSQAYVNAKAHLNFCSSK